MIEDTSESTFNIEGEKSIIQHENKGPNNCLGNITIREYSSSELLLSVNHK